MPKQHQRPLIRITLIGLLLVIAVTWLVISTVQATHPTAHATQHHTHHAKKNWAHITIKPNDSLSHLFLSNDLDYNQVNAVLQQPLAKSYLLNLQPNHELRLQTHNGTLLNLEYDIDNTQTLHITNDNDILSTTLTHKKLTKKTTVANATITSNLSNAADKAHIPANITNQLSTIYASSINFQKDIQPGDTFSVLYSEYDLNNKKVKDGTIIAATINNRDKTVTAVEYTHNHSHQYYQPDGKAMEPLFLKYPLTFTRISSSFSMHRMDPIRHVIAPHLGVDFAAPIGTPIKSIGDGTMIFQGWSHGFGRTVIITYGKHMRALYAHMDRFADNLLEHVKKGQVIGYVGQSGRATGPHLHFGIYIDGTAVDPLKLTIPSSAPIPDYLMSDFIAQRDKKLKQLNSPQHPTKGIT